MTYSVPNYLKRESRLLTEDTITSKTSYVEQLFSLLNWDLVKGKKWDGKSVMTQCAKLVSTQTTKNNFLLLQQVKKLKSSNKSLVQIKISFIASTVKKSNVVCWKNNFKIQDQSNLSHQKCGKCSSTGFFNILMNTVSYRLVQPAKIG